MTPLPRHNAPFWSLLALTLLALHLSCGDSADDEGNPFDTQEPSTPDTGHRPPPRPGQDTDGDGWLDEVEEVLQTDYLSPDTPCASERYTIEETFQKPRADFVFIVDTSGSMIQELPLIRSGLQSFFGPLLANPELDFKIILITDADDFGEFCIEEKEGCQATGPIRTERFLFYDSNVGSRNALQVLLETFYRADPHRLTSSGWQDFLRDDARLVITTITDDDSSLDHQAFLKRFRQIDTQHKVHQRTTGEADLTVHSIIGVQNTGMDSAPWLPNVPPLYTPCFSAANAGIQYQELSVKTGGLRFPICLATDYGAMLEQSTRTIIESGYVPCVIALPRPDDNFYVSSSENTSLQLEPEGQAPRMLRRVGNESQCATGDFYIERANFNASTINLCPTTCEAVQEAKNLTLRVATSCAAASCSAGNPTHTGQCSPSIR